MSYNSSLLGVCPAPFYQGTAYSTTEGFIEGRVCLPTDDTDGILCCLPCPTTDWIYSDDYYTLADTAAYINMLSMVCMVFLLVSYAILPQQYTRSHYLNTCLAVSALFMTFGFVIPRANHTDTCVNPITPNDMYSSTPCALSGAFLIAGACAIVTWVLIRVVSMHLQICWNLSPGRKFFIWAQICGWLFPGAVVAVALTVTGVSFRFGPGACHIDHDHSIVDYWLWLLVVAGLSITFQLATMIYCFYIYLSNLWATDGVETEVDESARVYNLETKSQGPHSVRRRAARAIFNRFKRVFLMQWRGLIVATLTLFNVIFFTIIFIYLNNATSGDAASVAKATPWIECLLLYPDDPAICYKLGQEYLINIRVVGVVLILLALIGTYGLFLLGRWSIVVGWYHFWTSVFTGGRRFDSSAAAADPPTPPSPAPLGHRDVLSWGSDPSTAPHKSPVFASDSPRAKEHGVLYFQRPMHDDEADSQHSLPHYPHSPAPPSPPPPSARARLGHPAYGTYVLPEDYVPSRAPPPDGYAYAPPPRMEPVELAAGPDDDEGCGVAVAMPEFAHLNAQVGACELPEDDAGVTHGMVGLAVPYGEEHGVRSPHVYR